MNLATILSAPQPSRNHLANQTETNDRTLPPLVPKPSEVGTSHHRNHSDPLNRSSSPGPVLLRPVFTWGSDNLQGSSSHSSIQSRGTTREMHSGQPSRHQHRAESHAPYPLDPAQRQRRSFSTERTDSQARASGFSSAEEYTNSLTGRRHSPMSPESPWNYPRSPQHSQGDTGSNHRVTPPIPSRIDSYDYESTSFGASVNRVRERSRNNTEDERYLLLSHDHWVARIRPDKVWCKGCEGDIELDDREHQRYYTSGFTKHRKTCAGRILKLEVLCDQLQRQGYKYSYNSADLEDLYWKDDWSSYVKDLYLHARDATPPRKEPLWLHLNRSASGIEVPTLEKRNVRVFYDDRVYVKGSYTRGWVPKVEQLQIAEGLQRRRP